MAIFKKKHARRRRDGGEGPKRFLVGLFVVLLSLSVLGGFWFLSQLGPKQVDFNSLRSAGEIPDSVRALQRESLLLEGEFKEILSMRAPEPEDIALLKQALEKQRAYILGVSGLDSAGIQRKAALEQRYQEMVAKRPAGESLEFEAAGERLAQQGDFEAAIVKYREAYERQRQINENFPLSGAVNVGRATRLDRQIRHMTAQPLFLQSIALEEAAQEHIDEASWKAAEASLQEAINLQDRLNREYRGTNQASVARLEQLRRKLVGIRSGQSFVEVQAMARRGDEKRAEGAHREAAFFYEEAARLQRALNQAFRDSPHASSERAADFQRRAQTAESFELGLQIERNHDRMQQLLSERRTFEATELIASLRRDIRQMEEAFPRSSMNDEDLQIKIRYLNLVQNDLSFIQDRIYDSLLPIPEETEWLLLRTEVSQALYSVIMGTTPSRNPGDLRPVDSVSWLDAKDFCERLSWILGKPVRLPTENEFRNALGRLRYVVLEDHAWSAENSKGLTQPVGTKEPFTHGFNDLLGNVSEWLESEDRFDTEDAIHIGGHTQDRLEVIFSVPVREDLRTERNRLTGFRVVVKAN